MRRHLFRCPSFPRLLILALGAVLLGGTLVPSAARAQPRPMIEVRVCKTAGPDVDAQAAFDFTIDDNVTTQRRTIRAGECASVMVWDGQITVQEAVPPGYAVTSITADKDWPVVDKNLRLARARFFAFGDESRFWTITFHNARVATPAPEEALPVPPITLPALPPIEVPGIRLPVLPSIDVPPLGAPQNQAPPPTAFNWGIHANGWQVCLRNSTGYRLIAGMLVPTDNVAEMPDFVDPQRDNCTLRGRPSIWGGPANISFKYFVGTSDTDYVVRLVSWYPRGTSPAFNFTCTVTPIFDAFPAKCRVVRGTMQEPVFVIFENY